MTEVQRAELNIQKQLSTIKDNKVCADDKLLLNYVNEKQTEYESFSNPEQLFKLEKELKDIAASVSSKEVIAVKTSIDDMRSQPHSRWLSHHNRRNTRAAAVEQALCLTKLEDRGSVLSSSEANPVQESLAAHGWLKIVRKTSAGGIDLAHASHWYKKTLEASKETKQLSTVGIFPC